VKVIEFTGGELFLHPNRFLFMLQKIFLAGRYSSVITNGLWSLDWDIGRHLLEKAHTLGLRGLAISVDAYHRPVLPVSAVVRLLRYARELGMAVNVRGVGSAAKTKISKVQKSGVLSNQERTKSFYNLERTGLASGLPRDDLKVWSKTSCLSLMSPLITPNGNVYACCSMKHFEIKNPVLCFGNIKKRPLRQMLRQASHDYLLGALMTMGPAGLCRMLSRPVPRKVSRCDLCLSILNDPASVLSLRKRIASDKELRKEIVARALMFDHTRWAGFLPQFESA
jgi:hypothetical protein